jgi:hypothetical protein
MGNGRLNEIDGVSTEWMLMEYVNGILKRYEWNIKWILMGY